MLVGDGERWTAAGKDGREMCLVGEPCCKEGRYLCRDCVCRDGLTRGGGVCRDGLARVSGVCRDEVLRGGGVCRDELLHGGGVYRDWLLRIVFDLGLGAGEDCCVFIVFERGLGAGDERSGDFVSGFISAVDFDSVRGRTEPCGDFLQVTFDSVRSRTGDERRGDL